MTRVVFSFLLGFYGIFLKEVITEVVIAPVNVTVSENQAATLTCTLTGTSEAVNTFSWYYGKTGAHNVINVGIIISPCESILVPINTSVYDYQCPNNTQNTLTIKKVTRQNHGDRYQCLIGTSSGNENSEFTFVQVQVPISSVTMTVPSSASVTLDQGALTVFKCKTSGGLPAATVNWFKDSGTPGNISDDIDVTSTVETSSSTVNGLIDVTSTLTYSPSKTDNGWRIYCTASNINRETPAVSQRKPLLNVQYPHDGPPIVTGFSSGGEYRVIEGRQGQLSCSISGGNPAPTLTWNCINSGTPQTTISGIVTKVHTWMAKRGQDRTCTCTASHYSGNKDVSIRVTVLYPPTKPIFRLKSTPVSKTVKVIRHNPLSVTCSSEGLPEPSYIWTLPNRTTSVGSQLIVSSVWNNGRYTCDAQNTMGPSVGETVTESNSSFIDVLILYPPVIGELINTSVVEGSHALISCPVVVGNPPKTMFAWKRNSTVWKTTQNISIDSTSRGDATIYTCTVFNVMQQTGGKPLSQPDTKSFYLNVWYRTSVTSFVIEGNEASLPVQEHHGELKFICEVDSNPASILKIIFDGKVLKKESNTKNLTLTIKRVGCLDMGVYTCEGYNNYGPSSRKDVTLLVICPPRPFRKMRENVTSLLHVLVTLQFTAIAYPPLGPEGFSWAKQNGNWWTPLLSNADLQISAGALQSNLTILNVSYEDFGIYRLNATNSKGSYVQYFRFLRDDQTQASTENAGVFADTPTSSTYNTPIIISLGVLCSGFEVYAVTVSILYKRSRTLKGTQSPEESVKQKSYVNVTFKSDFAEHTDSQNDHPENMMKDADDDNKSPESPYTSLSRKFDERTIYDELK